MKETTLCYIRKNDKVLMLHRIRKHDDENEGKWIGVGGHIEPGESPEVCVKREVWEETGFILDKADFRGVVDFFSDRYDSERMYLFTSDAFSGEMHDCDEGVLEWVPVDEVMGLNLWEGDRIFLEYLKNDEPFFHLVLRYEGDALVEHSLRPRFILASQSPRRKALLQMMDIFPEVIPSRIEERTTETSPADIVEDLSRQKASGSLNELNEREDYRNVSDVFLLAADTIVVNDGKVLGKPDSHEEAYEMINGLQGKTHEVYTGVTIMRIENADGVFSPVQTETFSERTEVEVYPVTDAEIREYTDSDEPMDKAGAYGIQGSFCRFVKSIKGDYNNVVGLPVSRVYQVLKKVVL